MSPLSDDDKRIRSQGIGGSDVAAVCGLNPYRKPIDVYLSKIGEAPAWEGNERTKWGELLEPLVCDEFADRHPEYEIMNGGGTQVVQGREWHVYTVDRLLIGSNWQETRAPEVVLEAKSRGYYAALDYGDEGTDDVPKADLCQGAWYMAGENVNACAFAVLMDTHQYREFWVERDLELEGYLLEHAERFWSQHVLKRIPPDPDGSLQFSKYLAQRFDKTSGELARAGPEHEGMIETYRLMRRAQRVLATYVDVAEQEIKTAIGDSDGMQTELGKVSYKFDKRGRTNWKRVAGDLADLANVDLDGYANGGDYRSEPPRRFITPRSWAKDLDATDVGRLTKEIAVLKGLEK